MKKFILLSILIFITTVACYKKDHFGKSNYKRITQFSIENQIGNTLIDDANLSISIAMPLTTDLADVTPSTVVISNFASIYPDPKISQDFSTPVIYTVTAEDGSISAYTVTITTSSSNIQLENSSFDTWYQTTSSGKTYDQPGSSVTSTLWATGNAGTVTLGDASTSKELLSGTDYCAVLKTLDLGAVASITGQRMGAGTIFTGTFVLNLADPISSTKFGVLYSGVPTGFKIDYTYVPGTPYKNGNNQVLSGTDSCDIYVLLENRNGSVTKRVASAWYRESTTVSTWTTLSKTFIYGAVDSNEPYYMQLPAGQEWGTPTDPVTHISVVCSSSARGNVYEGGVNSVLKVNNFTLVY